MFCGDILLKFFGEGTDVASSNDLSTFLMPKGGECLCGVGCGGDCDAWLD
jgi:hypothetical protein